MLKYEGLPRGLEIFRRGLTRMKIKSRGFLFLVKNKLEVLKSRDLFFRLEISKPRTNRGEEIVSRGSISSPRFARGFEIQLKKFSRSKKPRKKILENSKARSSNLEVEISRIYPRSIRLRGNQIHQNKVCCKIMIMQFLQKSSFQSINNDKYSN